MATPFDVPKGIQKKILYAGKGTLPDFVDGTRIKFFFKTLKIDENATESLLDDNKTSQKPMEIILGKKFKLEYWEGCLKTMRLDEIARFDANLQLSHQYIPVAKQLRDIFQHKQHQHCCGMMAMKEGLGYCDLDELMKNPKRLAFIFEVVSIEFPEQFEKESWCMTMDEKSKLIPALREKGNELYRNGETEKACAAYREALGYLEQLMLREKPEDTEWNELLSIKLKILLNYCQCQAKSGDDYDVIEHCDEILKYQPDNVKALYRRAKSHLKVWNPEEARADLDRVQRLDPSLAALVQKDLAELKAVERGRNKEDKEKLAKLFD